jgi:hypothetical protein
VKSVRQRSLKKNKLLREEANILHGMNYRKNPVPGRRQLLICGLIASSLAGITAHFYSFGQDKSGFPDGYDAVQAAPNSHKVIFENALVRVLEVTVPPTGGTVPMHHHRWPSLVLDWDTGGVSPHIHYRRPDGSVRDIPSQKTSVHPGVWVVQWSQPEPMHAIEVIDNQPRDADADEPPELRIEIKTP